MNIDNRASCRELLKKLNILPLQSQYLLSLVLFVVKNINEFKHILPPNMRLHRHPHCPNSCKFFCQTSSVLTCRNCTVCQCSWCCMQDISLLITPTTIWSPVYPNLWMCLVRDSGLFIFLTRILIWSYSVAVPSQLYWTWIQDKELHTHTHTLLSIILAVSILPVPYCLTILCRFLPYTWHVRPILVVSWQPHCLLPHIRAAGSVAPYFDLPLSQRTVTIPV